MDEAPHISARIEFKRITRRWARRGTRPRAPHDQRTGARAYISRRYLPGRKARASRLGPAVLQSVSAMALHLQEISRTVAYDEDAEAADLLQ